MIRGDPSDQRQPQHWFDNPDFRLKLQTKMLLKSALLSLLLFDVSSSVAASDIQTDFMKNDDAHEALKKRAAEQSPLSQDSVR